MGKHHVTAKVNGDEVEFLCEPQQTLLEVLRDELRLTGTKEGCGTGDCGACSVTLDGRLVCSCLVLGVEAQGKAIETIEGMAQGEKLHVLQQKFLEPSGDYLIARYSGLQQNVKIPAKNLRLPIQGKVRTVQH